MANLKIYDQPPDELEKYDLCLVFPVNSDSNKLHEIGADVLDRISALVGAKYIYAFYSKDTSKAFVLIRAGLKLLKARAVAEGSRLLLDHDRAQSKAYDGDEEALVDPFVIPHVPEVSRYEPFDHIYVEYSDSPELQELFYRPEGMSHPFRKTMRVKMLMDILDDHASSSPDWYELSLEYLRKGKVISGYFPVHEQRSLESLAELWIPLPHSCCTCCGGCCCCHLQYLSLCTLPWAQPFHDIREYLGENIAFYFLFLGFWSFWILLPMVAGLGIQAVALYFNDFSRHEASAFAFFICLWGLTVVRQWQRVWQITAMKWDMTDVAQRRQLKDRVRFQFFGIRVSSPIDGGVTVYFRSSRRSGLYCISVLFMAVFAALTLAAVAAVLYARVMVLQRFSDESGASWHWLAAYDQWLTSALMSVQIEVCNSVLYWVAQRLTSWENHRTNDAYDFALTVKVFIFQFVSTFASFYYFAFAAEHIGQSNAYARRISGAGCGPGTCLESLAVHLMVVVATQTLWHALSDYASPANCFRGAGGGGGRCCATAGDHGSEEESGFSDHSSTTKQSPPRSSKEQRRNASIMAVAGNTETPSKLAGRSGSKSMASLRSPEESSARLVVGEPDSSPRNGGVGGGGGGGSVGGGSASAASADMEEERSSTADGSIQDYEDDASAGAPTISTITTAAAASRSGHKAAKDRHASDKASQAHKSKLASTSEELEEDQASGRKSGDNDEDAAAVTGSDSAQVDPQTDNCGSDKHPLGRNSQKEVCEEAEKEEDEDDFSEPSHPPPPPQLAHEDELTLFQRGRRFDQNHRLRRCYARASLLLGLALCFGSALPGVFLLVFIALAGEIRGRAWQFVHVFQRPPPRDANGIGHWEGVLQIMVLIAILTNASMVVFTLDSFNHWRMVHKLCLLIGFVVVACCYKLALALYIPAEPPEVLIQRQRAEFIAHKLISRVPDREPEETIAVDML